MSAQTPDEATAALKGILKAASGDPLSPSGSPRARAQPAPAPLQQVRPLQPQQQQQQPPAQSLVQPLVRQQVQPLQQVRPLQPQPLQQTQQPTAPSTPPRQTSSAKTGIESENALKSILKSKLPTPLRARIGSGSGSAAPADDSPSRVGGRSKAIVSLSSDAVERTSVTAKSFARLSEYVGESVRGSIGAVSAEYVCYILATNTVVGAIRAMTRDGQGTRALLRGHHQSRIADMKFCPDGRSVLASVSESGHAVVHVLQRLESGEIAAYVGAHLVLGSVGSVRHSLEWVDGNTIVIARGGEVFVWNVAADLCGSPQNAVDHPSVDAHASPTVAVLQAETTTALCAAPTGAGFDFVTGSDEGLLRFWTLPPGRLPVGDARCTTNSIDTSRGRIEFVGCAAVADGSVYCVVGVEANSSVLLWSVDGGGGSGGSGGCVHEVAVESSSEANLVRMCGPVVFVASSGDPNVACLVVSNGGEGGGSAVLCAGGQNVVVDGVIDLTADAVADEPGAYEVFCYHSRSMQRYSFTLDAALEATTATGGRALFTSDADSSGDYAAATPAVDSGGVDGSAGASPGSAPAAAAVAVAPLTTTRTESGSGSSSNAGEQRGPEPSNLPAPALSVGGVPAASSGSASAVGSSATSTRTNGGLGGLAAAASSLPAHNGTAPTVAPSNSSASASVRIPDNVVTTTMLDERLDLLQADVVRRVTQSNSRLSDAIGQQLREVQMNIMRNNMAMAQSAASNSNNNGGGGGGGGPPSVVGLTPEVQAVVDAAVRSALERSLASLVVPAVVATISDTLKSDFITPLNQVVLASVSEAVPRAVASAATDVVGPELGAAVGSAVAAQVAPVIAAQFETAFTASVVPAFEAGVGAMVGQIESHIKDSVRKSVAAPTRESTRAIKSATDAVNSSSRNIASALDEATVRFNEAAAATAAREAELISLVSNLSVEMQALRAQIAAGPVTSAATTIPAVTPPPATAVAVTPAPRLNRDPAIVSSSAGGPVAAQSTGTVADLSAIMGGRSSGGGSSPGSVPSPTPTPNTVVVAPSEASTSPPPVAAPASRSSSGTDLKSVSPPPAVVPVPAPTPTELPSPAVVSEAVGGTSDQDNNGGMTESQMFELLDEMIAAKEYDRAFASILASDSVDKVILLCRKVPARNVFTKDGSTLSAPVVLSLIQQLSVSLSDDARLKLDWMVKALRVLDASDPVIAQHVATILSAVAATVEAFDAPGGLARPKTEILSLIQSFCS